MRSTAISHLLIGALAILAAAFPVRAHAAPAAACDSACLSGFVDRYLAALAAHDPSRLPLAPHARFTENSIPLKLGDGLWGTISGLGTYRHYFADPSAGEVGFFGTILENGTPALLTLRLKVEHRKIAEIETLVVRKQDMGAFLKTDQTAPKPIFLTTLPLAERSSRADMVRIANQYFEGIEQGNGDIVPFDPACNRTENGTQTTNNKSLHPVAGSKFNPAALGCRAQFNTKLFSYIKRIHPRRFLIVDPVHGLVFGIFMFNHPGTVTSVEVPGVGRVPMMAAALRPFNVEVAELFKIVNGKIREIEAEMVNLPYGASDGWSAR